MNRHKKTYENFMTITTWPGVLLEYLLLSRTDIKS
ncbi:aa3-type cytochrome c oxidase subunit IV [Marinobacter nauticus]